ncbi:hypothetical protein HYU20_03115 [Candidatus Woesearchaeota archaeon]|nr:hypothetical protein [Candidatus Woesearchaeota archaeon]
MGSAPLEYRLLDHFQKPDEATTAVIIHIVDQLLGFVLLSNQEGKPKVVVDNNAIAMRTPASKMFTAAGYVPHSKALYLYSPYLYSPTTFPIIISLQKTLEEMTQQEIAEIASREYLGSVNPQLLVALQGYALEDAE